MRNLPGLFLFVVLLVSVSRGYEYQCEPGTDPTVCSLWNFQNSKKNTQSSVKMPSSVKKVRLNMEQDYYERHLGINVYDSVLHLTILHNPTSVQIESNHISDLYMPTDLQMGEFKRCSISDVHIDSSLSYSVTYLSLQDNSITDISNFSALVKLQTLNLEGNMIRKVDGKIFAGMHNLSTLYLGDNSIKQLDFKVFPKALVNLWLGQNQLSTINFVNVSLPILTVLDLEGNLLGTIDLAGLGTAVPELRFLLIALNPFNQSEARSITTDLKRRNVSSSLWLMEPNCEEYMFKVSNVCFIKPEAIVEGTNFVEQSIGKALVLLVLAAILLMVFTASLRWIWHQMRN
ncbi:uncharacterized protein LOC131284137 [Anopheles ziemanni]|uniref:uncharacterized protein LOC131271468 n=1 Tax=Anopheles coustani TaxID=139045 RepID=UPI002658F04E|nr:uncharacterized protein LOC131271468 [Anopheles coustani]XP_058168974.1 uncharacterized protein LOC131284137 [Anopheles ziemanni]